MSLNVTVLLGGPSAEREVSLVTGKACVEALRRKGNEVVEQNLTRLGCKEEREPGANARRLAVLCAATVLCGEISLLAAQTNPGELMRTHFKMERG